MTLSLAAALSCKAERATHGNEQAPGGDTGFECSAHPAAPEGRNRACDPATPDSCPAGLVCVIQAPVSVLGETCQVPCGSYDDCGVYCSPYESGEGGARLVMACQLDLDIPFCYDAQFL